MGNICGPADEESQNNIVLSRSLDDLKQRDKLTKKLLLLGSGNSGKSTIFKQLRQIHGKGFGEKDVIDGLTTIYDSVLGQMKTLIARCRETDKFMEGEVEEAAQFIDDLPREAEITEQVAEYIDILWRSEPIRTTFDSRTTLGIVDSCPHFFNDIYRVGRQDYTPNEEDLLLVRSPTTGVTEANFQINKNEFKIFDVGGQRNERRKWIHCFENVTAVLFIASLSAFDQALYEDETINAMHDSLNLFEEICNSRWFRRTSIILFLNKSDLFGEKIEGTSLTVCYEDYVYEEFDQDGEPITLFDHASDFIRRQYHARNHSPRHKHIYTHITCATDRDNIQRVFHDVQHIVINASLQRGGLL